MTFERREVSDASADREVRRALNAKDGEASLADLIVATGLAERVVEAAASRLVDRYEGAICVAKGGALSYRFALGPFGIKRRREDFALWRAVVHTSAAVTTAAVHAFEVAFRVVLAVQLLVYAVAILTPLSIVAGAVVGVVLIIALLFSGDDSSGLIDLLTDPYGAAFVFVCAWAYGIYLVFQKKVEVLLAVVGRDEHGKRGVAGFIAQINDFALGPDAPPSRKERIDRAWRVCQDDERCVLERIRQSGGRLRAGDLVVWLGLDFAEAERQATRIAVEYGGVPGTSDIDVLEFRFDSLEAVSVQSLVEETSFEGKRPATKRKRQPQQSRQTRFERGVTLPRLTANTTRENMAIAAFALVNSTVAYFADRLMMAKMVAQPQYAAWWHAGAIAGGKIPLAFSAVLFGVFFLRIPVFALRHWVATRRLRWETLHGAIVRHVRARGEAPLDLAGISAPMAEARKMARALEGDFDLDSERDPTKLVWRFSRLAHELGIPNEPAEAACDSQRQLSSS